MYESNVRLDSKEYHLFFNGSLKVDNYGPYSDDIHIEEAYELVDDGGEQKVMFDSELFSKLEDLAVEHLVDFESGVDT